MKKTFGVLICLVVILSLVGTVFAAAGPPGPGWYTGITFQNVDQSTDTTPATVEVTAYGSDGSTATANLSIGQNKSASILPTDFTGMGSGFQGGAIASSSKELRSIVNVTNRYLSAQGLGDSATPHAAAAQYQGMSNPSTTLLFPLAKNNYYGKNTTFYIQNAGSLETTATATFVFAGTSYTFTTPSLKVGQTAVFSAADAKNGTTPPPSGNVASAVGALTVTSTQPLAGVFLEHKTTETHATLLQSTRAFTPSDADSSLFVPVNKDNYINRFTGLQVQNVGPGSVDLKVTYTTAAGGSCTVAAGTSGTDTTTGLAQGASFTFTSDKIPGDKCLASAMVEVTGGTGKIVGVINESFTGAYIAANPGKYQESTTYFAFPKSSVTNKVSIPVFKEDSFNKATGVTVQNVSTTATAKVVATFIGATGTYVTKEISVNPGASYGFLDVRNSTSIQWNGTALTAAALGCTGAGGTVCGANGLMAMVITADQPIVAIANESTYPITNPRIQQDKNNFEGFNLP